MLKVNVATRNRVRAGRITAGTVLVYPMPTPARSGSHRGPGWSGSPVAGAGVSRPNAPPAVEVRSYLFYLAVAFALAVALSWSHSATASLGYRIGELKAEIAQLEREHEKLSFELSALESMTRVEAEATGRLGMIRPEYVRIASIPDGRSAATTSATAAVIQLTPTGTAHSGGDDLAAGAGGGGGRGLVGSLWERLYRWLTGISQAEAGAWN